MRGGEDERADASLGERAGEGRNAGARGQAGRARPKFLQKRLQIEAQAIGRADEQDMAGAPAGAERCIQKNRLLCFSVWPGMCD